MSRATPVESAGLLGVAERTVNRPEVKPVVQDGVHPRCSRGVKNLRRTANTCQNATFPQITSRFLLPPAASNYLADVLRRSSVGFNQVRERAVPLNDGDLSTYFPPLGLGGLLIIAVQAFQNPGIR